MTVSWHHHQRLNWNVQRNVKEGLQAIEATDGDVSSIIRHHQQIIDCSQAGHSARHILGPHVDPIDRESVDGVGSVIES